MVPMIRGCPHCGLIQRVPDVPAGMRARCPRCEAVLRGGRGAMAVRSRTAAIATTALVLYPLAVALPVVRVEKLGRASDSGIIEGVVTLFARGDLLVGLVVLACSVVVPVLKLAGLLALSAGGPGLADRHRVLTYRLIEWTGRWGMLDVLLVAILVAVVKLGDMVHVSIGPGLIAFALCVALSLLATASFDPRALWEPQR